MSYTARSISVTAVNSSQTYKNVLDSSLANHPMVVGSSIVIIQDYEIAPYTSGYSCYSVKNLMNETSFLQCASLSKTVAAAFSIDYFTKKGINIYQTSVNSILEAMNADWKIESSSPSINANEVTLNMLINHTALGMHYVYGVPLSSYIKDCNGDINAPIPLDLLNGNKLAVNYGYKKLYLERKAGTKFSYSGGGFVLMQFLLEVKYKVINYIKYYQ